MAVLRVHRSTPGHEVTALLQVSNQQSAALNAVNARASAAAELGNATKTAINDMVALVNEMRIGLNAAVTLVNEVKADHNALLAKLDADAGVTDVDYAALHAAAAVDASAVTTPAATAIAVADVTTTVIAQTDTITSVF